MSYSIMSHYLIRSPLLPIERRNKVKGASSFEGKVAFLEDVLDDEVFVEAIEWGSPALYSQVCKFRDGCNRNDETSIDKLYYSVLKYYLRALYRATPYGLFSGIDIGEIGDCDSVVRVSQNSLSLQIRPDFEVISKLVRDIESDSELDSLLEFRINPNHYLINNRIIIHHLSAVYCEDITSNKTVSLRESPLLDKIISHFRGQLFTKRDLKRFILSIHPDVSMDLLKSYTNNLVHSEFIISSIRPPFSGEDSISYINAACQKLKNSSKSVELVGKICSSLEKLQRAPIGKRENEIRKMRENLSQKGITFKDALQADLKINYSNNTLSRTSIAELESTLSELLSSITGYTENLTLAKFKSRFLDKYGYFKAVRLPEALDPYSELYEYGPSIQSNFTDSRSKAVKTNQTFSIICDKIETSRNSRIFINSEDLLRLSDGASKFENLPPRTFDYSFNIIKELGQANQYLISPIVGTNGYGMVMGRFAYLLDEEKQQWLKNDAKDIQKRCFDAGYVVVEYHEYPSKARIGDLNQSMNLFDYQICLSTNSSKEAIELDINDFYVGIDKQGFIYVYSESLDKRVIFAFQNMVNPHLLSPIGNFLMAVSHQFPNDLAYFIQDVKNCPIVHLPRVVFKNIILSPERWSFDVSSRLESLDSFKTFVRQQMETHSIPSIIEYGISDNRMIVDLTDPDQIHMVYNELKAKKSQYLTLYEPLYLAKSWTSDCFENHYNAEYVFSIYENTDERDRTTTVDMHSTFELEPLKTYSDYGHCSRIRSVVDSNRRIISGGFNWWNLSLYSQKNTQNELIVKVYQLSKSMKEAGTIDKWFFIRYSDPNAHIRVRFQTTDSYNCKDFFQQLMTEIQNLIDDGVLITYSLCPYERDLERYGGPQIYEDAENVFCLNSNIVASFFLLPTEANELKTILLGIYVISDIMSAFGLTLKQQEVVLNSIVHPKEHRDFYRKNRSRYIECIEAADLRLTENLFTTPLSTVLREHFETVCKYVVKIELLDSQMQLCNSKQDIIYSLIHMFCNRLFQDSRFERYALAVLRHCIHDINQKRAKLYTLNK